MHGCPYGARGDRLWVREPFIRTEGGKLLYRENLTEPNDFRWKPGMFLPRDACRLTLELTDVRVERLQEISEEDARAEGVPGFETRASGRYPGRQLFRELWGGLNEKRGYGWETNPWVWALGFRRVEMK